MIKGYAKHFGVDKMCAIKELELLGVAISERRKIQIFDAHKKTIEERAKKKKEIENEVLDLIDSDDRFAFIVGYTSGGAPYGVEWDEPASDCEMDEQDNILPW
jgi:hypothetical protein